MKTFFLKTSPMKFSRAFALLGTAMLSLAIATSCSKGAESDLKVSFPGAVTFAVPQSTTGCASSQIGNVPVDSFVYRNITLSWTNTTDSVNIVGIKLEFKSNSITSGGTCLITGEELGMVFSQNGSTAWDGNLSPSTTTISNTCAIKCGGLKYTAGISTTTAVGDVTVIGIQRSPAGDEKPVKGTTQVKLNFGGL